MNAQHMQNNRCLDSGLLAALRDDELMDDEKIRVLTHLAACDECAAQARAVKSYGKDVYELLDGLSPAVTPAPDTAFAALQARIAGEESRAESIGVHPIAIETKRRTVTLSVTRRRAAWIMAAAAALLIIVLVVPNASALANQFLMLFQVQQFQPVSVNPEGLSQRLLADLQNFGEITQPSTTTTAYPPTTTLAQIENVVHFHVSLPASVPPGVGQATSFSVATTSRGVFVFDAGKTRAYLARSGQKGVSIPKGLNGASFSITTAPGLIVQYFASCTPKCAGGTPFYLAEVPSPVIQGASSSSLNDLRGFLLSLPALPSELRALLQPVNQANGTVPLPIPVQAQAQRVTIQGTQGVLAVDSSINEGGVLWQAHGIIYLIVSETSDSAQLLHTANSLR